MHDTVRDILMYFWIKTPMCGWSDFHDNLEGLLYVYKLDLLLAIVLMKSDPSTMAPEMHEPVIKSYLVLSIGCVKPKQI